jgi:hypothetical protein
MSCFYLLTAFDPLPAVYLQNFSNFFDVNLEGLDRFHQRYGYPPLPIRAFPAFDNQCLGIFTLAHS